MQHGCIGGLSPMNAGVLMNGISVNPDQPVENRAITFFLTAMIVEPLSVGRVVGHLELVPRLYLHSLSTSALAKVTTAMAISAFCVMGQDTRMLRERASRAYGEAITKLLEAIRNEEERVKNETLLACVLMVVVESLLEQSTSPTEQWLKHVRGASELLRQHGWDKINKDPVLSRLFAVVRGFLLRNPANDPVSDGFFHREISIPRGVVLPAETRLGRLAVNVAYLRDRAFHTLTLSDKSEGIIDSLVAECKHMNQLLLDWEASLPENYRYTTIDKDNIHMSALFHESETNHTLSIAKILPTQLHCYPDPHLQRLWNSYRVTRIFINTILHRASTLPFPQAPSDSILLAPSSASSLETLVSDILASIPLRILDSAFSARNSSGKDAAEIALAYHCLWPLYIARGAVTLGLDTRSGIRRVMKRIVYRYEVRNGVALMEAGDAEAGDDSDSKALGGGNRPLWCGPWPRDWIEGVWEWTFLYGCGTI